METIKQCFKCGETKALSAFYKHQGMADGHLNKCKSCAVKDSSKITKIKISTQEGLDLERQRHREKYHRLGYKEIHKPAPDERRSQQESYKQKYPEKMVARKVRSKIKGIESHHWSYNKEHLGSVIELTIADHNFLHRYIIYDQERMMYRTREGILLDTKENHIEHFNYLKQNYPAI